MRNTQRLNEVLNRRLAEKTMVKSDLPVFPGKKIVEFGIKADHAASHCFYSFAEKGKNNPLPIIVMIARLKRQKDFHEQIPMWVANRL
jgi:hypothetical protein